MSATVAMLAEVPLLSLLDDQERRTLAGILETKHFDKGDTIFSVGDAGECLYVVASGRVEAYLETPEGEKIVLTAIEPGELLGEIALFDSGARTASAVAVEDTEVLVFDRDHLLELVSRHPSAALNLLAVLGRRLRNTDELLRSRVSRNLNEEEEERLTFGQRVADRVATFGGSWTFILLFGGFLLTWMGVNAILLAQRAFDPYPFILLNLALSALAALQAPVIMMSQNRQSIKDRLRADLDYQINLKAELEVAQLHGKIDRVYEQMQAGFAKMERDRRGGDAPSRQTIV